MDTDVTYKRMVSPQGTTLWQIACVSKLCVKRKKEGFNMIINIVIVFKNIIIRNNIKVFHVKGY